MSVTPAARQPSRQPQAWLTCNVRQSMKFFTYIVIGLAASSLHIRADEPGAFLQPVDGYLSSYAHSHAYLVAVRSVLVRDAVQSPAAMVTLPSSQPEYMVFLESKGGQTFVVFATANTQIWSAEKRARVTVSQKEKPLRMDIADVISAVFALATSQSHYPKEELSDIDGVSYHFSAFIKDIGLRAGQTCSPHPQTTCGRLVALGEHLCSYVRGDITAEKLESEANELLNILKKNA